MPPGAAIAGKGTSGSPMRSGSSDGVAGSGTVSAGGLMVLIKRGGGSAGAAGLGGSAGAAPFLAAALLVFFAALPAASEKMSPFGSSIPRWRARRSTNWRATISSSVLDALFSSMP